MAAAYLYQPAARDKQYQGNFAQYLVDLHDANATFDFCGGMMCTQTRGSYCAQYIPQAGTISTHASLPRPPCLQQSSSCYPASCAAGSDGQAKDSEPPARVRFSSCRHAGGTRVESLGGIGVRHKNRPCRRQDAEKRILSQASIAEGQASFAEHLQCA